MRKRGKEERKGEGWGGELGNDRGIIIIVAWHGDALHNATIFIHPVHGQNKPTSSYLEARSIADTPTSCNCCLLTALFDKKRSIMDTVRYKDSGFNLNLEATSTSQSMRMPRMVALMSR